MNLCSSGHDEVCYEGRSCPVCEVNDNLSDKEKDLEAEKENTKRLENKVDELEGKVSELESQITKEG
jgi:peptidoglycan hydrolase CwlO-like protein